MTSPLVTVVVPSLNQGQFLDQALTSIFIQEIPMEVFVIDGGSTDNSIEVIDKWSNFLAGWRSHSDDGQASAINEGVLLGSAPYVCWLNSDDWFLPNGLINLVRQLEKFSSVPAVYGKAWNFIESAGKFTKVNVEPFSEHRLALRCIISQPATLIRRSAWNIVGGLDKNMQMAMDYDLWWRLYKEIGPIEFFNDFVAVNRSHKNTKTNSCRKLHYREAISTVRRHYGSVPWKWWLAQPYSVFIRSLIG